jgi:RNA polymerase sigma-70 factor (ECF subfamily)
VTDASVSIVREREPSSSLLLRVQAQEQAAWVRLVHLYSPVVYQWCRHAGLQEADALDVGQEIFEAVWRNIRNFRRDRPGDSFRAWLRTIAHHKIVDHHRQRDVLRVEGYSAEPTRVYERPDEQRSDVDEADGKETRFLCRRALALIRSEFEDKSWQAFEAVVMNDQKPAEVAAALHMSVNAVYLARSRILKRLREEFADLMDI